MRKIKLRAWDKESKKWLNTNVDEFTPGYFLLLNGDLGCYSEDGDFMTGSYIGSDIELVQFTDRFDKNDKEIYEGDILKFSSLWVVEWNDGAFIAKTLDGTKRIFELRGNDLSKFEVVGNIYENPELLTKI